MALKTLLRGILGSETVVYECRNCGTTLDAGDDSCPECDSEDVVEYEFD
jgi:rubrerythrin